MDVRNVQSNGRLSSASSISPTPVDHTRAIVASLFSAPAGSKSPPNEQHLAHVQVFEGQPGTPERKARFLIISALNDGRLRLHKAKQNANGTFSIGKTWALEDLRGIEVGKRMVAGSNSPQPLEFTLSMNGKTYKYETELPSSQQAAFLVKTVRCWRTYMAGRGQPDLLLAGFSVDSQRPITPSGSQRPTTPANAPRPTTPSRNSGQDPRSIPQSASNSSFLPPSASGRPTRPSTSASSRTMGSSYGANDGPLPSVVPLSAPTSRRPPTAPEAASGRRPSGQHERERERSDRSLAPPRDDRSPPNAVPPFTSSSSQQHPNAQPSAQSQSQSRPPALAPTRQHSGENPLASPRSQKRPPVRRERLMSTAHVGGSTSGETKSSLTPKKGLSPNGTPLISPGLAGASSPGLATSEGNVSGRKRTADEAVDDDTVLNNVEEMLEGFEWSSNRGHMGSGYEGRSRDRTDEIEKRLVGELKALEAASIYAIMESDDRATSVVKHLDQALAELDKMDVMMGFYKTQLNLMTDDIAHIESQNRGLQVQTSNQRQLLSELDNLLETIHIPDADLTALTHQSLENSEGIEKLERAGVSLYKALVSTRDTAVGELAAASERVGEYRSRASQFSKRIYDFLVIMFKFQVDQILNPKESTKGKSETLPSHSGLEEFLGRYCGLMLFVKEIDPSRYQQICSAYFASMSDLYRKEIQEIMSTLRSQIRRPTEEELESSSLASKESPTIRQQSMRRVGTVVRSPMESKAARNSDGKLLASEAFNKVVSQIAPHVIREQGFIADFLSINDLDASITFADYMTLDTFFRRGAMNHLASQHSTLKDLKSAMGQVFGFLEPELRDWIDGIIRGDSVQIIGILAALDKAILASEKERNEFLLRITQRQHAKCLSYLERHCKEQIKGIEQTKLTLKKRKGVVPFVRIFPNYVTRVESQLDGADKLNVRQVVNDNYERMVATIFDSLQQMAKMDGEGQGVATEDKDQLNYHVIIIENMHHIVTVFSKRNVPALSPFVTQAKEKYQQNLDLYIRLVLRRPLARLMDFFQGLEQLLRTTPPTEISLHSAYTRSAMRRATSEVRAKDLRKAIDALYKRVDKHFGDVTNPSAEHALVIKTVWKACEEELLRLTATWKGLIEKCYPDEKAGLEYTRDDVQNIFAKANVQ